MTRYNTRRKPPAGATQAQGAPVTQGQSAQVTRSQSAPDKPDTVNDQRVRPTTQHERHIDSVERHNCGMCDQDLGSDQCIGCDACESWFHANEMCTGLPHALITSLLEYGGSGVRFVCSKCRVSCKPQAAVSPSGGSHSPPGANDELIKQLFWSVKGICVAIRDLTSRLDATLGRLSSGQSKPAAAAAPVTVDPPDLEHHRRQIREEVREIREQEKRKQSVIIRGLGASSSREAANLFATFSQSMFGVGVELTDVVAIPNHPDLLRAKILNEEHRRLILTRAKSLRDTDYGHVYIKRDLTYNQRKELKNRAATTYSDTHAPQMRGRPYAVGPAGAAGAVGAAGAAGDALPAGATVAAGVAGAASTAALAGGPAAGAADTVGPPGADGVTGGSGTQAETPSPETPSPAGGNQ